MGQAPAQTHHGFVFETRQRIGFRDLEVMELEGQCTLMVGQRSARPTLRNLLGVTDSRRVGQANARTHQPHDLIYKSCRAMADYRRYFVSGGTYFFTVCSHKRRPIFTSALARKCLRRAIKKIQRSRPFEMVAIVLLPDHLHTIWSLPRGDDDYPTRWRRIKEEFTRNFLAQVGGEAQVSDARRARGERGIWQRRSWEHTIRDETDFECHFDYIHYNPVKHGLCSCPRAWAYSSFHRWVRAGVYDNDWGCAHRGPLSFDDLDETAME